MNTEIRRLEDEIIAILNQSSIPIETKRLIIADVLHIVTKSADDTIRNELNAEVKSE